MPRVPYQPVPDVSPQFSPAPQIRIAAEPAAFGANIAQAIQHVGATEEQVGGELAQRALAMQELRNETERMNAVSDFELRANDEHVKFSALQGNNAVDAYPAYRDKIDSIRAGIRDGMSNDMARKMFDSQSLGMQNRFLFNAAGHAATQNRVAAGNARQARIDSLQGSAALASEEDLNGRIIPQIRALSQANGEDAGAAPEVIQSQSFREESKARARFIEETARRDPVKANQMLDKARTEGQIHSLDLPALENIVHSNLDRTATRSFIHGALNEIRNPEGWLSSRGAPRERGVDPDFGQRLTAALNAAERENPGYRAQINSLVRTTDEQAKLYQEYKEGKIGLAAPPGTSRHELGRAADIQSGPILDWLHKHAQEYGLEFLPGWKGEEGKNAFSKDPGHIQLADAKPLRELPAYSISERQFADLAVSKAQASGISDVGILDRIESGAMTEWRRQKNMDNVENQRNIDTVMHALDRPNAPQTLEDLLKTGPDVAAAWENIPWPDKRKLERQIAAGPITDLKEYDRLVGMANGRPEDIEQFIAPDMYSYIRGNPNLSVNAQNKLLALRQERINKRESDVAISQAMGQLEGTLPDSIVNDKEQMHLFRGTLHRQLLDYKQQFGKPMPPAEIETTAQRLLQTQTSPNEIFKGIPLSTAVPDWRLLFARREGPLYARTPTPEAYNKIKQDYAKAHGGIEPSDELISQIYVADEFTNLYGKRK